MLFAWDFSGYEWMIGLGMMFGLALVMTVLTIDSVSGFFGWLLIFCGFVVYGGLLPLWVLVICIIAFSTVLFFEMSNKKGGGSV